MKIFKKIIWLFTFFTSLALVNHLVAQQREQERRPPVRKHTITERGDLKLNPAIQKLSPKNRSKFEESKKEIKVEANGIPKHKVGRFPSRHNQNSVEEQDHDFSIPTNQKPASQPISLHNESTHPAREGRRKKDNTKNTSNSPCRAFLIIILSRPFR